MTSRICKIQGTIFTYPIAILAEEGGEIVALSELVVLVLEDGFVNTPDIKFDY